MRAHTKKDRCTPVEMPPVDDACIECDRVIDEGLEHYSICCECHYEIISDLLGMKEDFQDEPFFNEAEQF